MFAGAFGVLTGAVASACVVGAIGGAPLIKHAHKYLVSGVNGANRNCPQKGDLFSLPNEDLCLKNFKSGEISISICCGTIIYPLIFGSD